MNNQAQPMMDPMQLVTKAAQDLLQEISEAPDLATAVLTISALRNLRTLARIEEENRRRNAMHTPGGYAPQYAQLGVQPGPGANRLDPTIHPGIRQYPRPFVPPPPTGPEPGLGPIAPDFDGVNYGPDPEGY